MNARITGAAAIALTVLVCSSPVVAHHSFAAEWDSTKCREFTGTLTKLDWQNPHPYFYMDIKDAETARSRTGRSRPTRR